ncbi:helix-turn-helix domain-containing protein [Proteus mirabilis]|uniref:Cro/CI family transcriptional regulator n=1 Tax=Proteus mirabilis TaxID=584 RepID=UPI0018C56715|nr:Cro/CI family transcriptional regulator [Proteus mirabilis]MBG2833060.1 helix-turn-helix domain-containing protein [Proteus mirabilis]MCM0023825.1 helix-turn-helix domain-containing protein [Proteus mirabilis]
MNALETTIKKAGGIPALAKKLKISDQAIRQWKQKGRIPPARYAQINELFGIPFEHLVKDKN